MRVTYIAYLRRTTRILWSEWLTTLSRVSQVASWTSDKEDWVEDTQPMSCKLGLDIDNQLGGDFTVTVIGKSKVSQCAERKFFT